MKNASSDDQTEESFNAVYRRSSDFKCALMDDLIAARRYLGTNDTQFARRIYCRTVMAFFEGIVNDLRSDVLFFDSGVLGQGEVATLKRRLGALESAFHSFNLYTNVAGAESPLERNSKEWRILKKAIEIRNRITHLKSQIDLEISDLDLGHLRITEESIFDLLCRCLKESAKARLKHVKTLKEARKRHLGPYSV